MNAQELKEKRQELRARYEEEQTQAQAKITGMSETILREADALAWATREWMKEKALAAGLKPPFTWQLGIGAFSVAEKKIRQFCPGAAEQILKLAAEVY